MLRRSIMITAAAVALILVPSAAMAYQAPGITFTVSDATPTAGAPFTATVSGAGADAPVTLTITSDPASISSAGIEIAGTKTLTKTGNASGVVTFTVTLSAAGTLSLIHISEPTRLGMISYAVF